MRRVSATALSVLFLATQFGVLIHRAVVTHVRCAEHGELVHGADRSLVDSADHTVREPTPWQALAQRRPLSESDDHEHCKLCISHRETLTPSATRVTAAPITFTARPKRGHSSDLCGISTLRRAPKTSPPV